MTKRTSSYGTRNQLAGSVRELVTKITLRTESRVDTGCAVAWAHFHAGDMILVSEDELIETVYAEKDTICS